MKTFYLVVFISLFSPLFLLSLSGVNSNNILDKRIASAQKKAPASEKWQQYAADLNSINKEIVKQMFDEEYRKSLQYLKYFRRKYGRPLCDFLHTNIDPADSVDAFKTRHPHLGEIIYLREMALEYHKKNKINKWR